MRQPTEEEIAFTLSRVRALSEGRLKIKAPDRTIRVVVDTGNPIAVNFQQLPANEKSYTSFFEDRPMASPGDIALVVRAIVEPVRPVRPPGKPENARVTGHCARCPACDRAVVTRVTPKGPIFGLHRETIESSSPHCHKSFKLVEEQS